MGLRRMGIVTSTLPGAFVLGLLGGTLVAAVSFAVELFGRAWKYDVRGVQAIFFSISNKTGGKWPLRS